MPALVPPCPLAFGVLFATLLPVIQELELHIFRLKLSKYPAATLYPLFAPEKAVEGRRQVLPGVGLVQILLGVNLSKGPTEGYVTVVIP